MRLKFVYFIRHRSADYIFRNAWTTQNICHFSNSRQKNKKQCKKIKNTYLNMTGVHLIATVHRNIKNRLNLCALCFVQEFIANTTMTVFADSSSLYATNTSWFQIFTQLFVLNDPHGQKLMRRHDTYTCVDGWAHSQNCSKKNLVHFYSNSCYISG